MFLLKLEQNLFAECSPEKIASAREYKKGDSIFRTLKVDFTDQVKTMTVEKRKYPYFFKHYLYWEEDLEHAVELKAEEAKRFLLEFYRRYRPEYLKEDSMEYAEGKGLEDYFQTDKIPGESMQHFVAGEGAVSEENLEKKKDEPAYAALEGYHEFNEEEKQDISGQLDALKNQFADQLKELEGLLHIQKGKE